MPSTPAAVIFDNDGLTLNTEDHWTRAEVILFERHGRTFTHDHKLQLVGTGGKAVEEALVRMLDAPEDAGGALVAELRELVAEELARGCAPMPGAVELLQAMRSAEIPLALCSNTPRRLVDGALRGAGLSQAFDATVAGDEVAQPKPAPDPYLRAAAALGIEAAACIALEDSATGAASARAAGMFVIGVPSVPGVTLDGVADAVHRSLEDPALWARLGL